MNLNYIEFLFMPDGHITLEFIFHFLKTFIILALLAYLFARYMTASKPKQILLSLLASTILTTLTLLGVAAISNSSNNAIALNEQLGDGVTPSSLMHHCMQPTNGSSRHPIASYGYLVWANQNSSGLQAALEQCQRYHNAMHRAGEAAYQQAYNAAYQEIMDELEQP